VAGTPHDGIQQAFAFWAQRRHAYRSARDKTASEAYYELFSVCGDLTARKRNRTTEALETRVFLKVNSSVLKELCESEVWQTFVALFVAMAKLKYNLNRLIKTTDLQLKTETVGY